jgi:NADH dehydrogenase/NADH:ubiquinone oxidoreductase subunit G
MKLPKVVETMLNDKNVLYIVAFLAIMNFFGYIILRDSYALLIFLSVGFISTYFSKNMTVVLLSTLLLTNFITVLSRNFIVNKEGFDATAETDAAKPDAATATAGADATKPDAANGANGAAKKPVVASGVAGAGGASNKASKKVAASASSTAAAVQNGKKATTKEPMTELSPASLDDEDDLPVNNRVDYAKTLEKAYDNLENLVGKDGVNGLTSQTTVLMDQQQKLMENMKSMEPLLKTAQSFLDKFESSSMGKLFEKIPGMSSMFGGASGAQPGAQNGNVKGAAA